MTAPITSLLWRAAYAAALISAIALTAFAQDQPSGDKSYDIALHLVLGSNDTGAPRSEVPRELDGVIRQARSAFSFANYKLLSTFAGRVGETGEFSYKSVADIGSKDMNAAVPTFLDWSLEDLRAGTAARSLKARSFRFGIRLPVSTGGGEGRPSGLSYENIGLTVQRLGLAESLPTLLGTVHLPGTSGTIFVIITIRPVTS